MLGCPGLGRGPLVEGLVAGWGGRRVGMGFVVVGKVGVRIACICLEGQGERWCVVVVGLVVADGGWVVGSLGKGLGRVVGSRRIEVVGVPGRRSCHFVVG